MNDTKELNCYQKHLYNSAKELSKWRTRLLSIEVIFLIATMFFKGNFLYIILVLTVITHVITEILKYVIQENNDLAHKFQQTEILINSYHEIPNDLSLSYLKSNVPSDISRRCQQEIRTQDNTLHTKPENKNKLFSMIQENAFWNHHLYKEMYHYNRKIVIVVGTIAILLLLSVPFLMNDFLFLPYNLVLIFLSASIYYELIEMMMNYKKASEEMSNIDKELSQIAQKNLSTSFGLDIFTKYILIKKSCPYIDEKIYEKNKEHLNKNWDERTNKIS